MFVIMFENEAGIRRVHENGFKNFDDAKQYLKDEGFVENNRLFERENYNWITFGKAFITHVKEYLK